MQYDELIDLGPPQGPVYSTAYLFSPKSSYIVRGNHYALIAYLAESSFPSFFGKIVIHRHNRSYLTTRNLISKGLRLSAKRVGKRVYYFFESDGGNILFKRTRRFPNKWLDCIVDVKTNLLISADYLEEHGFIIGAEFIRDKVSKWYEIMPEGTAKINMSLEQPIRGKIA